MGNIVKILMDRDEMSKEEAVNFYREVMKEVNACIADGDMQGAEDTFCDEFGLEPDYILDCVF